MNIPKKIKVGGTTYTIKLIEEMASTGVTDFPRQEIKIHKGKEDIMNLTFLHEVFHTINNEFKEVEIEALAQGLYGFIKDNPGVFK